MPQDARPPVDCVGDSHQALHLRTCREAGFFPIRTEMQVGRLAEVGGRERPYSQHAAPQHPIGGGGHILRPESRLMQRLLRMYDAGSGDRVASVEILEAARKAQICGERDNDAVGGDPERAAVAPGGPLAVQQIPHQGQMIGQQQIIMRSESDESPPGLAQREVAVRVTKMRCLRQIEKADPRVLEDRHDIARAVGASISDDEKLEIRLCLGEHGLDGEAQDVGPVMSGQQNRETRRARHPPVAPSGKR